MLLPVPMEGLCPRPAFAIGLEDAMHFPIRPVRYQDLARLGITLPFPQHHDSHRVLDTWDAEALGEILLALAIHRGFAPTQWPELCLDPLAGLPIFAIHGDGSIEFQITDIGAPQAVDMIEDLGSGEVTVEGDIAGNILLNHPIDQLFAQHRVILERLICGGASLLLPEAPKLEWIVLARGTHVVRNQVIMGDQVALVGMIPEPASIFNQLAIMVDQGVIDRDDAVFGVTRGRVGLQEREPPLVEGGIIPIDLGDPAVQTGLIGRDGKLTIDAADSFAFGDEQAGQIFSKVPTFGFVGKQVGVLGQQVLYDRREFHYCWHTRSCCSGDSECVVNRTTGTRAVQLCKTTVNKMSGQSV